MKKDNVSYGILITTGFDNKKIKTSIHIVNIDMDNRLHDYYKHIGCRIVDVVYMPADESGLACDTDMIVDDEALLVDEPVINPLASILSRRNIYGNVIIMKYDYDAMDTIGFDEDELQKCWNILFKISSVAGDILGINIDIDKSECKTISVESPEVHI